MARPGEARFGLESDGEKLWWRQVFRARKGARKERKWFILIGIQRGRLGAKVRPGEARFGPELDGEKLWRRQVFGARMVFRARIQRQRLQEMKEKLFFC